MFFKPRPKARNPKNKFDALKDVSSHFCKPFCDIRSRSYSGRELINESMEVNGNLW
jgi:hypothetical protein